MRRAAVQPALAWVVLIAPLVAAPAGDRAGAGASPVGAHLDALVAGLDDEGYTVREQSMRALFEVGAGAVDPVREAALKGSCETRWRALRILETWLSDAASEQEDAARSALELLAAEDDSGLARSAAAILRGPKPAEAPYQVRAILGLPFGVFPGVDYR